MTVKSKIGQNSFLCEWSFEHLALTTDDKISVGLREIHGSNSPHIPCEIPQKSFLSLLFIFLEERSKRQEKEKKISNEYVTEVISDMLQIYFCGYEIILNISCASGVIIVYTRFFVFADQLTGIVTSRYCPSLVVCFVLFCLFLCTSTHGSAHNVCFMHTVQYC